MSTLPNPANSPARPDERAKIMARIREALQAPAPHPGLPHHPPSAVTASRPAAPAEPRRWLPPFGDSFEAQLALFAQNATELKADFQMLPGGTDFAEALASLAAAENWQRLASHDGPLTRPAISGLKRPICWTDHGYDVQEMEKCDAGITECDALVAQTGSVLVTSRSAGGRALSVLPPHHVVLARRAQLVADLPAAFALLQAKYGGHYPSMISFITGPSRTGDIERILVLGAHGPKKLTILCG